MSVALLGLLMVFFGLAVSLGVLGFWIGRQNTHELPRAPTTHDAILEKQAERIEHLEDELRRVKDQADFTERLLTERSSETHERISDENSSDGS